VLSSTGDVQQFCFQLTSELGMGYNSPPLPIQFQTISGSINTMNQSSDGGAASNAFTESASERLNAILSSQSVSPPTGRLP
jgi:hypothetical protein